MYLNKSVILITQVLMVLVLCFSTFTVLPQQAASAAGGVTPGTVTWSTPPVGGGRAFPPTGGITWPLAGSNYVEDEYFMQGTANVYEPDIPAGPGFAIHTRTTSINYVTRVVIRRPNNPASFSGNVLVEFMNPTMMVDRGTGWLCQYPQIIQDGDI